MGVWAINELTSLMMKVCLFSSFFLENRIPNWVIFYLKMLLPHFDKIYLITNRRYLSNINILKEMNISCILVANEGFDFGMYYSFIKKNLGLFNNIKEMAFINDSCICFKKLNSVFEYIKYSNADICGITDSIESAYHIQSYFVYYKNKSTIRAAVDYFLQHKIKQRYQDVVAFYEIGLMRHLISLGYNTESLFSYTNFLDYDRRNIIIYFARELLKLGCPFIKKKVLFGKFNSFESYYLNINSYDFEFSYFEFIKKFQKKTIIKCICER